MPVRHSNEKAQSASSRAARSGGQTAGGINANKSKKALYEDARKAGIEGRSKMNKAQLQRAVDNKKR